ncbi:MAG: alpha/beta fold hydrolase [Candidatus Eisenbacteria bacterium]|nr:alpha/beta fold hydrolase [Candidatus Eisenbacteria bacterium]
MRKFLMISAPTVAVLGGLGGGLAWLALYPVLPRDLGGAEDLDARARHVRIAVAPRDSLDAWYLPGDGRASVLLLHGYGRTHARMWRYGQFLRRAGYGVLAPDFRSSRAARRLPTTLGHYELADAGAALGWLRGQPGAGRLGVLGESLGGSVALVLAARAPDVVAVVADCAFASGREALEESCERWAHLPRWPAAMLARRMSRRATGCDPYGVDVVPAVAALGARPVFFIQALDDDRFSPGQVRELWKAAGSKDPLWLIPGAGHNQGWVRHRAVYERRVRAFFDRALLDAGPGLPAGTL